MTRLARWLLPVLLAGCAALPPAGDVRFIMVGDQQYDVREERLFSLMLDEMNRRDAAFVVHVGDIKAGSNAPCTDALYRARRDEFDRSRHPLIFTPGDNDWMDCRRRSNGATDPLERLASLRRVFYPEARSLGRAALPLLRQSEADAADPVLARHVENAIWVVGGVVFATVNVQGGNDNKGFDAASDHEQAERTRANIAWLARAAALAAKPENVALAVFLQANPGFEDSSAEVAASGYADFLRAFERENAMLEKLGKPVMMGHGDTHQYRVDHPYVSPLTKRPLWNATRVETWGSPVSDWLEIRYDRRARAFRVQSGGFNDPAGTPAR